jgi:hypothetical protein
LMLNTSAQIESRVTWLFYCAFISQWETERVRRPTWA